MLPYQSSTLALFFVKDKYLDIEFKKALPNSLKHDHDLKTCGLLLKGMDTLMLLSVLVSIPAGSYTTLIYIRLLDKKNSNL